MRPSASSRSSRTTSGSSTPSCWSLAERLACASARFRSTGSTIPTRGSTSCRRPPTTCAAIWRMLRAPAQAAAPRHGPTRSRPTSCCASPASVWSARSAICSSSWRGVRPRCLRGQRGGHGPRHAVQHRRAQGAGAAAPTARHARGRMALVTVLLYMVSLAFTTLGLLVAQWIAPGACWPRSSA